MKFLILLLALAYTNVVDSGFILDKGLGTDCLYDEDCITRNSFCKGNKICACKIGYRYDPGSDVCFPEEVDLKCSEDYDCSALQNAKCIYGKCQCKHDYVPSKDKSYCLPTMRITSICEEDSQCNAVLNRSYCDPIMRHCVCERGYRKDSYRMLCVEQPRLHAPCSKTEDCETPENRGTVVCQSISAMLYRCECAEGYVERNDSCFKDGASQVGLSTSVILAFIAIKWLI